MAWSSRLNNKYTRLEIVFFVFYYFLFSILTEVEIRLFEPQLPPHLSHIDIAPHLIIGLIKVIPVWILYKFIIERYLFNRQYVRFLLFFVLYLLALNFYNLYSNWLVSKLTFLPGYITTRAAQSYQNKTWLHLGGIMYTLREYMVLAFFAYFIRSAKQEEQVNQLQQQQLNAELKFLKVQLQPHFFFNTLNNIYALTLKKSDKAAPLVAKHADMMRYILYNTADPTVGLQQEITFLKNYIEVESLRYATGTPISFETQGTHNGVLIEPLLLLPVIENTFKHGLNPETGEGRIAIVACLVENELTLETKNRKVFAKVNNMQTGIGLKNMRQRLDILYHGLYCLETEEDDIEYMQRLTIKLRAND